VEGEEGRVVTHPDHHYRAVCSWSGSTAGGYDAYDRTHSMRCPPAETELTLTSDPGFGGDESLLDPEQLLLAAAVSCQLLSFLAVAAHARIDVLAYTDDAEADMPGDLRPMRITAIRLRPTITVAHGTNEERVHKLVEVAHKECFIANSLTSTIDLRATVVTATTS
jgi:organic hydroperoxide reductase OsmC/OhrA